RKHSRSGSRPLTGCSGRMAKTSSIATSSRPIFFSVIKGHSRFWTSGWRTVAYMPPERVGGDRLDRRTDLFSLGVVLYECVTGQQPFQGKTSAVILASILTQQPTPPRELNGNIPMGL